MPFAIDDVKLVGVEGGDNRTAGRNYKKIFDVYFSGEEVAGDFAPGILSSTDLRLPRPGSQDNRDTGAYADNRSIKLKGYKAEDATKGIATLEVAFLYPTIGTWDPIPWNRKPVISGDGGDITEIWREDADGNPIINSADDYYDPLFEQPVEAATFEITRFEQFNPANRASSYSRTITSVTWHGVAVGNACMEKIRWGEVREMVNGIPTLYYSVTYPVTVRPDGWAVKIIDNGYKTKDGSGNKRAKCDDMGTPTQVPILLDGAGGELPAGDDPVYFPEDGYKRYREADWTSLALPDPFATATP